MSDLASEPSRVLVLRTCNPDMTSRDGFIWPESGHVEAPDWDGGLDKCGGKLHGFLWGEGNGRYANWNENAKWLVVSVDPTEAVEITQDGGGKYGFRRGDVVCCGDRNGATQYILSHGASGKAVIGADVIAGDRGAATAGYRGTATAGHYGAATAGDDGTATAGDDGTATAGDHGTATVGDHGTATAGDHGTATAGHGGAATAGYRGTATAGYRGTATAGNGGTATAGDHGTATAGHYGAATAGYRGTATAGDRGTATAGYRGTATTGDDGTATTGDGGTATAGEGGIIVIKRWDGSRYRMVVGYVGEDGILPNVQYQLDKNGKFTQVA